MKKEIKLEDFGMDEKSMKEYEDGSRQAFAAPEKPTPFKKKKPKRKKII